MSSLPIMISSGFPTEILYSSSCVLHALVISFSLTWSF
jgi:hypothetical protein